MCGLWMVVVGLDRVHSDGVALVFARSKDRVALLHFCFFSFDVAAERPFFDVVFVDGLMSIRKMRHRRNPKSPAAYSRARSHFLSSPTVSADGTTWSPVILPVVVCVY